ncbi:hypothetical protein COCNU_06G019370 [Cocos nucifera]|uniref:Uncharacterized protein n=1 Tax=Cocos nucifera TaxID=13894 RepID=A0A8K0ID37_COCNU|nr:hypothetical protein COCNU_06G019370 [Cocos nucifera]
MPWKQSHGKISIVRMALYIVEGVAGMMMIAVVAVLGSREDGTLAEIRIFGEFLWREAFDEVRVAVSSWLRGGGLGNRGYRVSAWHGEEGISTRVRIVGEFPWGEVFNEMRAAVSNYLREFSDEVKTVEAMVRTVVGVIDGKDDKEETARSGSTVVELEKATEELMEGRVCGNPHGLIRKYGLMCCRQCFRSNAKDIGFIKILVVLDA